MAATHEERVLILALQLLVEARDKFIHKHATYAVDSLKWNCVLCGAWGELENSHEPTCLVARIDAVLKDY